MVKYKSNYEGQLRTETIHIASQNTMLTDAPTDNQGKGETFSPTDLLAVGLSTCILTVMGIKAREMGLKDPVMRTEVNKVMLANPRRIGRIEVDVHIQARKIDSKSRKILEHTAIHCPVAKSLHPEIEQVIEFLYYE